MNHRWMIVQGRTVFTAGIVLAALLFAGGCLFSHQVSVSADQPVVLLPTAMYHSVTDEGESPAQYVISPSMLERDLQYLQAHGRETITIHDLLAYVKHGTELPEKPVLLTFDDGYYNNYKYAYPLLKRYGMQAVLSPVGSLTEQFSQTDDTEHEVWSYCTKQELKEMADSGVIEIQNHSYDFHELKPRKGCLRMAGDRSRVSPVLFVRYAAGAGFVCVDRHCGARVLHVPIRRSQCRNGGTDRSVRISGHFEL